MNTFRNLLVFLAFFLATSSAEDHTIRLSTRYNKPEFKGELNLTNDATSSVTIFVSKNHSDYTNGDIGKGWKFSLIVPCTKYLEIFDNENNVHLNESCYPEGPHNGSHNHHPHLRHIPGHERIPTDTLLIEELTNVTLSLKDIDQYNFTIIASMYFEQRDSCDSKHYFDCHTRTVMCPNSGPNAYRYIEIDNPNKYKSPKRCIPLANKCNSVPSCGYDYNVDEADSVCHTNDFCQLIFNWMFIATRALVAVIFVVIPALVVYLLFQRRQVALHRARLLQERERMQSQRHGSLAIITMQNKYANDLPPTYDDLYDTKDPPPCFCAVQQQTSASPVDADFGASSHVNPSFECTCNSSSNSRSNSNNTSQ